MTKPAYPRKVVLDGIPAANRRQLEHLPAAFNGQHIAPLFQGDLAQQDRTVFDLVRQLLIGCLFNGKERLESPRPVQLSFALERLRKLPEKRCRLLVLSDFRRAPSYR